ncbi:MAG: hypothetical protein RIE06_31840 [Roseibium album]|uniref:hypothetical protein n=1 Tax=Roseibium album TaxID=311410 RepID=UPI0032EABB2D
MTDNVSSRYNSAGVNRSCVSNSNLEFAIKTGNSFGGRMCKFYTDGLPGLKKIMQEMSKPFVLGASSIRDLYDRGVRSFAGSKQKADSILTCGYSDRADTAKAWSNFSKQLNSSLNVALYDSSIDFEADINTWKPLRNCQVLTEEINVGFKEVDRLQKESQATLARNGSPDDQKVALGKYIASHKSVSGKVDLLKKELGKVQELLNGRTPNNDISKFDGSSIQNSIQKINKVIEQSSLVLDACIGQHLPNIEEYSLVVHGGKNRIQAQVEISRLLESTHSTISWAKAWVHIMTHKGDPATFNRECRTVCRNLAQNAMNFEKKHQHSNEQNPDLKETLNELKEFSNTENLSKGDGRNKARIEANVENKPLVMALRLQKISKIVEKLESQIPAQGSRTRTYW